MVGIARKCPVCGTVTKRDHRFCNLCGHRLSGRETACAVPVAAKREAPRIVPSRSCPGRQRPSGPGTPVPRRWVVSTLLALLAMVPFTPWVSTFDGILSVCAVSSEALYGRYILLLAVAGMPIVFSERLICSQALRRVVLAGVGAGALLITASDYLETLEVGREAFSSLATVEPGMGMYLGAALGVALMVVTLLPDRSGAMASRSSEVRGVRPGSRGSGP